MERNNMEIEPDGSLCRITSTAKHIANNVQIVKVPENELQSPSDPHYKLVFLGEEEDNSESSSESDDEAFKEFIALENSIKLRYSESTEKDNNKVQETTDESKPQDEKFTNEVFDKKYRSNNNTSRYRHKSGSRNFNGTKPYNRKKPPSQDIEPWLFPPVVNYNQPGIYTQFPSAAEPSLTNSAQNEKTKPVGLLGDSPYSSHLPQHNFQHRNQNNNFPRQEYWDRDYPSQYQRPGQSMRGQANKKYHNKDRYWKNKDRSRWNHGNRNDQRQNRRVNTERFERYRK